MDDAKLAAIVDAIVRELQTSGAVKTSTSNSAASGSASTAYPRPQLSLSNRVRQPQHLLSVLISLILLSMNTVTDRTSRIPRIRMV